MRGNIYSHLNLFTENQARFWPPLNYGVIKTRSVNHGVIVLKDLVILGWPQANESGPCSAQL